MEPANETLPHIKRVSRIKHAILQGYLPPWAVILGSTHGRLNYIDCFAGPGRYEFGGQPHDGSPIVALGAGKKFLAEHPTHQLNLFFAERDAASRERLEGALRSEEPFPSGLGVETVAEDSAEFVPRLLRAAASLAPSFFFVDPYGHPLAVPIIRSILSRPRCEALVTLMWFRINMDLANAAVGANVDRLFGDAAWRHQGFVHWAGPKREEAFLNYFISRVGAKFVVPFRIGFDPEDRVVGNRTKYYLLHASNHIKAALLMKSVMWPLGDEDGTFDYSSQAQGVLISRRPKEAQLRDVLLRRYAGRDLTFSEIVEQTWELPFLEKHYRSVLKQLRTEGVVSVRPVSSKAAGLRGLDRVAFRPAGGVGDCGPG